MPELLNVAISGLLAHQRAISTTGHNIANVNTEGYSRQQVINTTRVPQLLGGSFLGSGVTIADIRRITDQFLVTQVRNDVSALNQAETLSRYIDQLDKLFSGDATGLNASLDRFYAAVQGATDSPTSIPARQVVLSSAENLANQFETLSTTLIGQEKVINQQIDAVTTQLTLLSREVANLNGQIAIASGTGGGSSPNDLLDRRENALRQMAELAGITVVEQDGQQVNVFIGNGQAIVLGTQQFDLITQQDPFDPTTRQLAVTAGGISTPLGNRVTGGILGGLVDFRDGAFDGALNSLGRISLGLSTAFNQQHQLGMDLENDLGGNFFSDVNSIAAMAARVSAKSSNSVPQDHSVEVRITDIGALSTSDYSITFTSPATFEVTRLTDGAINTAINASLTGAVAAYPAIISFDGLSVTLDRPSGSFATGDNFLVRPTRSAPEDFGVVVRRPEDIALASPIRTEFPLSNTGTGEISQGVVLNSGLALFANPGALSPPLLIQFTGPASYDILDNSVPGAPVALVPSQTGLAYPPAPGASVLPASFGIDVDIIGQPNAGDTFTVSYNTDGIQDNRNGLALASLQSERLLGGGTTTLDGAYGVTTRGGQSNLDGSPK